MTGLLSIAAMALAEGNSLRMMYCEQSASVFSEPDAGKAIACV
jgi:hypothetical protein